MQAGLYSYVFRKNDTILERLNLAIRSLEAYVRFTDRKYDKFLSSGCEEIKRTEEGNKRSKSLPLENLVGLFLLLLFGALVSFGMLLVENLYKKEIELFLRAWVKKKQYKRTETISMLMANKNYCGTAMPHLQPPGVM